MSEEEEEYYEEEYIEEDEDSVDDVEIIEEHDDFYTVEDDTNGSDTGKRKLTDLQRKILAYSIVTLVAFSFGCGLVGFSMLARENGPRKELANVNGYLETLINTIDISTINSTSLNETTYIYSNDTQISNFDEVNGIVSYFDTQETLEYMTVGFTSAPNMYIKEITFHINEKSQLNVIIFADGNEVYNGLKMKNQISLEFVIPVSGIQLYVF